jgi:hypothetical protein
MRSQAGSMVEHRSVVNHIVAESKPTITHATPATWRMLLDAGWTNREKLRA